MYFIKDTTEGLMKQKNFVTEKQISMNRIFYGSGKGLVAKHSMQVMVIIVYRIPIMNGK